MSDLHPSFERILITNDDGINASGMAAMRRIAAKLSDDVWVVAPLNEQSGAGHSLSLTLPLRMRKIEDKVFAISGTPTDCVMMALNHVMKDKRPTLVLSGVNRGINLGEDVTYSGTVAGAMEGTLAGVPSIALSQQRLEDSRKGDWDVVEAHAPDVIKKLVQAEWPEGVFLNVNFPAMDAGAVKGIRATQQGQRDLNELKVDEYTDPRGFPYYWFGLTRSFDDSVDNSDLKAVRDGYISVTPCHLDLTHYETLTRLQMILGEEF